MGELCNIFPEEFIVLPVQVLQYNNGVMLWRAKIKLCSICNSVYFIHCAVLLNSWFKTTVFLLSVFCIKNAKVF